MSDDERIELRRAIGTAVLQVQDQFNRHGPVLIPEIVAALMSLAAYIAKANMQISSDDFRTAANMAVDGDK